MWRVFEIHRLVRSGRFPNCSTLAQEIEVTAKTIQRDISFMRDQLGMPLEYDAIRHGYHYTQEVSEFPLLQLSRNDLVALFLARHALDPLRGTIDAKRDAGEDDVREAALAIPTVQAAMAGKPVRKLIVVKNKIVNIVV